MFLSRFGVKGYKCLEEVDIPLTPIHVLIGENDAGKTSLLEAMAAFCASSDRHLSEVFPGPWTGRELVFHGSSEPRIELSGEWCPSAGQDATEPCPGFSYGLPIHFATEGSKCWTRSEWVEREGKRQILFPDKGLHKCGVLCWCASGGGISEDVLDNIGGLFDDSAELHLSRVLKPAHTYALQPKCMALPAALETGRKFRLDPDGFGLPTLLDDILGYDANLFIHIRKVFCQSFPQFATVRVETESVPGRYYRAASTQRLSETTRHEGHERIGKAVYFDTRDGETIRAQQASDGAILFLGFLALAHLPDPPNLLLIEEPENGVYPKRLGEVIRLLKDLVQREEGVRFPQIVMSTHSPYVLSFFEPEEVTFLSRDVQRPHKPVCARPLRDAPNIKERLAEGDFYLGELWYNLSEEELFGEP